jgi:hypothetical protein
LNAKVACARALYLMLQNRIYRGDIVHQGTAYPGQHAAVLDPEGIVTLSK